MSEDSRTASDVQPSKLVDNSTTAAGNAQAVIQSFEDDAKPKIPEKFKDKSLEDVVKSYQELETFHGKQAQELGELRKLTDAYIKHQMEKDVGSGSRHVEQGEPEKESFDFGDLDPDDPATIKAREILEKELIPVKAELVELKKEKFINKLSTKHNDFETIIQDKSFQDWVMDSPMRVELFKRADMQFDFDSANELFNIWKEKKGVAVEKEQKAEQTKTTNTAFEQARMETSSLDEAPPKKTYRRADIIDLMRRDPERYRVLEPEIRRAYAEKRVV